MDRTIVEALNACAEKLHETAGYLIKEPIETNRVAQAIDEAADMMEKAAAAFRQSMVRKPRGSRPPRSRC